MQRLLGHKNPSTIAGWSQRGWIPAWHMDHVLLTARRNDIELEPVDFFDHKMLIKGLREALKRAA